MEVEVSLYGHLRRLAGGRVRRISLPQLQPTVGDLRSAIAEAIPVLAAHLPQSSVGMGVELFPDDAPLRPGVEISILPPASGGSDGEGEGSPRGNSSGRRIQETPLSLDSLLDETGGVDGGALVVFGGIVRGRDKGREISALDYDFHPAMAEVAIRRIEEELSGMRGVLSCRIVHRVGTVEAGEASVYVVVRARHRPEAFAAAREGIERLKVEVPIWKEDLYAADGAVSADDAVDPSTTGD